MSSIAVAIAISCLSSCLMIYFKWSADTYAENMYQAAYQQMQSDFDNQVARRVARETRGLERAAKLIADPDADAVISAVASVPSQARHSLINDDVSQLKEILAAISRFSVGERKIFIDAYKSGLFAQDDNALAWVMSELLSGSPAFARTLGAFAAHDACLVKCIDTLPPSCTPDQYEMCRR